MNTDFIEWGEQAQSLLEVKMTMDDMESYFIDSLGLTFNDKGDLTTRSKNMLNTVVGLLGNHKNTLNNMDGTAWAAYNAVTEAIDHNFTRLANGEVSTKRMESALFGTYNRTKQKAWVKAMELTQ